MQPRTKSRKRADISSSTVVSLAAAPTAMSFVARSMAVQPGRMELKRIPSPLSSRAVDFVTPTVAIRTELERIRFAMGCLMITELTVSTLAFLDRRRKGRASRVSRTNEKKSFPKLLSRPRH